MIVRGEGTVNWEGIVKVTWQFWVKGTGLENDNWIKFVSWTTPSLLEAIAPLANTLTIAEVRVAGVETYRVGAFVISILPPKSGVSLV